MTTIRSLRSTLCLLLALALGTAPGAEVRLPALFSDGLVLQRNAQVPVWGWAEPGEAVTVTPDWPGASRNDTRADEDGRWQLTLATPDAGGPHAIRVEGTNLLAISDVLVGEVWLGSGQSNMEWKIAACARGFEDFDAERAKHDHPHLRLFDVRNRISMAPLDDVAGTWRTCTPETWPEFGAVAFYFALALEEKLDVPIGIITADWGGTPAESWTSREGIAGLPDYASSLERIDAALAGEDDSPSIAEQRAAWWKAVVEKSPGGASWHRADFDDSHWPTVSLPGPWDGQEGLRNFDGVVWYRRTVEVPEKWVGRDLSLELGPVDDMDTTWFDGERVGGYEEMGYWGTPRSYRIPGRLVDAGRHTIVVRAVDTGGIGGFAGEPALMRLCAADDKKGYCLALAGQWRWQKGPSMADLGPFPSDSWFDSDYPTALHNGMIAPLIPFRIRGAIWYQGESNREAAPQYRTLFPAMIRDWRRAWGQGDFPFYYVQIAPYGYGGDTGQAAMLREAQMLTMGQVPNTGMAVTMDIGEPGDIHPANKWDVGRRLARWALARDYGIEGIEVTGPIYRGMKKEGARIRLYFDHTAGGLRTPIGPVTHVTIAGEDRVFHSATAIIEGETLVVWGDDVGKPVAVRYGWGAADMPNLVNFAGLPASSFRTDDWE